MSTPRTIKPTFIPEIEAKIHRWASLEDGAGYAGIGLRTLRDMIARGEITGYRLGSKLVRVDLNEIDAAMKPITGWGDVNGSGA